jgi:hypothetical protein|tara:strand:+ start:276 stop:494 length:219 start_codon:yes stop_codon:yes gene_type:complete
MQPGNPPQTDGPTGNHSFANPEDNELHLRASSAALYWQCLSNIPAMVFNNVLDSLSKMALFVDNELPRNKVA